MLFQIILATSFISLLSLVGIIALYKKGLTTGRWLKGLISFAAGVMLAVSFVELIPEAILESQSTNILLFVLAGIIGFFILEKFIHHVHCHKPNVHTKPAGILVLIGDSLHNFFDGLAIAASFIVSPAAGIATTIAVAAHEIPQEIADFSVLVHSGFKPIKALLFNFITALTAVGGGLIGFYALSTIDGLTPYFLALTAGMFIYISLSDLIPELHSHKQGDWFVAVAPFLAGIILIWVVIDITHDSLGHSHSHSHEHSLFDAHHHDDDHHEDSHSHQDHDHEDYHHEDEHHDDDHHEDEQYSLEPYL